MFEWDEPKRLWNLQERHLDFVDAKRMFDSRPVIHVPSWRNDEDRFVSIAEIEGKLYAVVWTWRSEIGG